MDLERLARELTAHLELTRPLVCVDLEATGVWPGHDRIVQIAAASLPGRQRVDMVVARGSRAADAPGGTGHPRNHRCDGGVGADLRSTGAEGRGTPVGL